MAYRLSPVVISDTSLISRLQAITMSTLLKVRQSEIGDNIPKAPWVSRAHIEGERDVLFIKPQTPAYQSLLRVMQPKVVIPMHWDDFFHPLSKPIRPVIGPSGRVIPLLKRVDMTHFGRMVEQIAPETKVVIPEILRAYDLDELI
jgi:hypothetical protein